MTDYRCIFLLLMLAGLPASHADAAAAEKPNFIIYMSDDIGYDPNAARLRRNLFMPLAFGTRDEAWSSSCTASAGA